MKKNILYFEGAGMSFNQLDEKSNISDVGNYRIRTSFINLSGQHYYIELSRGRNIKNMEKWGLHIDHLYKDDFSIEELDPKTLMNKTEIDDSLFINRPEIAKNWTFTKNNITKWINENLNCDYDDIQVLSEFYNYRVHNKNGSSKIINHFEINHERAKAREKTFNEVYEEYHKVLNKKNLATSILEMTDNDMTIRIYDTAEEFKRIDKPSEIKKEVKY